MGLEITLDLFDFHRMRKKKTKQKKKEDKLMTFLYFWMNYH